MPRPPATIRNSRMGQYWVSTGIFVLEIHGIFARARTRRQSRCTGTHKKPRRSGVLVRQSRIAPERAVEECGAQLSAEMAVFRNRCFERIVLAAGFPKRQ